MVGMVLLGTLAAFGAFCLVLTLLGWFLPRGDGCALVCCGFPDEGILSRWHWLRQTGLLRVPLICVSTEETRTQEDVEICSPEALLPRLKQERIGIHGTGNGDPAGRHQRRGISEL